MCFENATLAIAILWLRLSRYNTIVVSWLLVFSSLACIVFEFRWKFSSLLELRGTFSSLLVLSVSRKLCLSPSGRWKALCAASSPLLVTYYICQCTTTHIHIATRNGNFPLLWKQVMPLSAFIWICLSRLLSTGLMVFDERALQLEPISSRKI